MKAHIALCLLLPVAAAFGTVIKPVGVTTTINGDAGSSHLYLLDDNAVEAAAGLQDSAGSEVFLDTGDTIVKGLDTFAYRAEGGHSESWTANTPLGNPVFTFDLTGGGDTAVGSALLWQYGNNGGPGAGNQGNSTREFSLIFHTEAEGDSFDFDTETVDFTGTMDSIPGDNTIDNFAQLYLFGAQSTVRYIALRIDNNYGGQPGITLGGDRYGLGEVRFATEELLDPEIILPEIITVENNGAPETIQVTISNVGTQDLTVTDARVSGTDAAGFNVLTDFTSPLVIGGGQSSDIAIEILPLGLPAGGIPIEATLEVDSDGWFGPTSTAPIDGFVRDPWIDSIDPVDLGLLSTNTPVQFDVAIENLGSQNNLNVDGAFLTGADGTYFMIDTDFTSALVIPAGGNAPVTLTFDPDGEYRTFTATLELDSDDPAEPTRFITLTAELDRDPEIGAPASVQVGPLANGAGPEMFTVQIDNLGTTNPLVLLSDPAVFGGDDTLFTVGLYDTPIGVGANGLINMTFTPPAGFGCYSTILEVESDDPGQQFTEVELIGEVLPPAQPGGLVAWWPLDSAADPGADASGNGLNGVQGGTGTLVDAPGANANTGGSLDFDGPVRIDIPQICSINPESYTVVGWAFPDTAGGVQSFITSRYNAAATTGTHGYILYIISGSWSFWTGTAPGGPVIWDTKNDGAPTVGAWQHLAISYDAGTGTKKIYVNGVEVLSEAAEEPAQRNFVRDLHIGAGQDLGDSFFFDGKIDDVAVFNTVLSQGDITTIMNDGVGGFLSPAVELQLVINGYDSGTGNLSLSVNNIPSGQTFHLESSTDLQSFGILSPVVDFDENTPQPLLIPVDPSVDPVLMLQAYDGPSVP